MTGAIATFWVKSAELGIRSYCNFKRSATVSNGVYITSGLRFTKVENGSDFLAEYQVNDSVSATEKFKVNLNLLNLYGGFGVERMLSARTGIFGEFVLQMPFIELKREFTENFDKTGESEENYKALVDSYRKGIFGDSMLSLNAGLKFYLF